MTTINFIASISSGGRKYISVAVSGRQLIKQAY